MRRCETCEVEIPQERLECIPDTTTCVKHSKVQGYVGQMAFPHKTGSFLVKVRPDENAEGVRRMRRDPYHANYKNNH
jgi:hypothetical protein